MKEIFTELYNKVLGFFQTQEKENTKENAYNRLKLVLMQDRTNLTPLLLEKMREELIELLSRYVEMDKEALELNFEQEGDSMALMLSIPVLRAKDETEIQAILDAEDTAKESNAEEQETGEELQEQESEESSEESETQDDENAESDEETEAVDETDESEETEKKPTKKSKKNK